MPRISAVSSIGRTDYSVIPLTLKLREPLLVAYFEPFAEPDHRSAKALEALKVGVIALQTASPCPSGKHAGIISTDLLELRPSFGRATMAAPERGALPKDWAQRPSQF